MAHGPQMFGRVGRVPETVRAIRVRLSQGKLDNSMVAAVVVVDVVVVVVLVVVAVVVVIVTSVIAAIQNRSNE